jgi:hypothetical protein
MGCCEGRPVKPDGPPTVPEDPAVLRRPCPFNCSTRYHAARRCVWEWSSASGNDCSFFSETGCEGLRWRRRRGESLQRRQRLERAAWVEAPPCLPRLQVHQPCRSMLLTTTDDRTLWQMHLISCTQVLLHTSVENALYLLHTRAPRLAVYSACTGMLVDP